MPLRPSVVDVYVMRGRDDGLEILLLRRAADSGRCPGSWEGVHGHVEAEEVPIDGARRELREETGLTGQRWYNLSRVELFHQHPTNTLEVAVAFAVFVADDAVPRLGAEHDAFRWVPAQAAVAEVAWPRCARAITDAIRLIGGGDAGNVEDVLRVTTHD